LFGVFVRFQKATQPMIENYERIVVESFMQALEVKWDLKKSLGFSSTQFIK
jgi:hypothetical protein